MSLLVWLPLNGNLNNQGLSDATFSLTASSTALSIANDGKIGNQSYQRTAQDGKCYVSSQKWNLSKDITMMCWAYVSGTPAGDTANGIITAHSHADNTGVGITIKQYSSTDYRISCSTGNGSSRTYHTYYGTTNIKDNWHHLALTYNKSKKQLLLYVDGVVEYTLNNYNNASKEDVFEIFNWSTTYHSATYQPLCKLNDIRLYDECLSLKEIKEISKGLILHYPMNDIDGVVSGRNLLKKNTVGYSNMKSSDDNSYIQITADTATSFYFKIQGWNNNTFVKSITGFSVTSTGLYTKSFILDPAEGTFNKIRFGFNGSTIDTCIDFPISEVTEKNTYTLSIEITNLIQGSLSFKNPKLEIGNNLNPFWTPAPEDGIKACTDDDTIYDTSGYGYHGTVTGDIHWNNDAIIGNGSYQFDANCAKHISTPGFEMANDFTWACWFKMKEKTTTHQFIMSEGRDYEKYGFNITINSNGVLRVLYGTNTVISSITIAPETWYHIAVTMSSTTGIKLYINGALKASGTYYAPDYAYNSDRFVIGKMSYSYTSTANYFPFNGSINDVRIYSTALSAEDIKEDLYESRFSLTDNYTLFCSQYSEPEGIIGGLNLMTKTNQGTTGWSWSMQAGDYTAEEVIEDGIRSVKLIRGDVAHSGWSVINNLNIGRSHWEPDTTYTVSIEAKSNITSTINPQFFMTNGTNRLISSVTDRNNKVTTEWSQLIWEVKSLATLPTSTAQSIYFTGMNNASGTWYQFRNLKIEKGTNATPWTPALEDMDLSYSDFIIDVDTVNFFQSNGILHSGLIELDNDENYVYNNSIATRQIIEN